MQLPSPVQQIIFRNISISIKRDDMIDPFVSGNKWRKLKYILYDAVDKGKQHIVTFGGAYSNHLLATAAACAKFNLKSTAFVRGEKVDNQMLLLCKLFGMQLIFTPRDAYKDKFRLFETYFSNNESAYFVNEGGANKEAIKGCAEIINELTEHYDHIFCAAGTGTTAAGILTAINTLKLKTLLHVVPVLKGGDFIVDEIKKFDPNISNLRIHTDYHFGGYAKTSPELLNFIKDFTQQTGILIDPVYTSKMLYAVKDLITNGIINANQKILVIHTGGLFGLFGMSEKLNSIL